MRKFVIGQQVLSVHEHGPAGTVVEVLNDQVTIEWTASCGPDVAPEVMRSTFPAHFLRPRAPKETP